MAKTIFNTSEKSNFILNMTEEKYSDIASKALTAMCLIVSLFTIPAECSEKVGFPIISGGLAIAGVVCLILSLIAVIKGFVDRKMIFPVCAFAAMLVWGVISLINSYDVTVSFYGFDGRGEGLLALIFYFGFFITGLTVKREKAVSSLLGGVIAAGVLNSVWGLLQVFVPGMPSSYDYVVVAGQINAASGLAQSPIFLAMLLSLSLTAAIIGFVMSKSKSRRIICIVCSCLFSFVMTLTYSLVGVCGAVFAVIAAVISVFVSKAPKIRLAGIAGIILPAALAAVLASVGIVGGNNSYKLHDGPIMWTDSYSRLSSSGIFHPDALSIDDTADVYSFLNTKTCNIIKKYPIAGTGPEQLVYPQLYSSSQIDENAGTFDKVYNEYLYTAATRGIPSLIALAALLISLIAVSAGRLSKNTDSLTSVSCFFLLVCGVFIFFIGCSNIAFSPIFWACAGASCAAAVSGASEKSGKNKEKSARSSK